MDAWRSTIFSTQTVYFKTRSLASFSCVTIIVSLGLATLTFWNESCGKGYFSVYTTLGVNDPKAFDFINTNICGLCEVSSCSNCQESQGSICAACLSGYWLDHKNNTCEQCL